MPGESSLKRLSARSRRTRGLRVIPFAIGLVMSLFVAPPASAAEPEYAAVAFSESLKTLREGFGPTANDAFAVALNACLGYARQHQNEYYTDCAPYGWVRNGYIGFAASGRAPRELDWGWGSGWGHTSEEAARQSAATCARWGGGGPGKAPCLQVGGSPFRSRSYNPNSPTSGGGSTLARWRTAPLPPTDLTATMINPTTIRLSWHVHRSDVMTPPSAWEINNGNVSRRASPGSVVYDWKVRPNEYMCFHVRGVNDVGRSWWEPNVSPWYRCAGRIPY